MWQRARCPQPPRRPEDDSAIFARDTIDVSDLKQEVQLSPEDKYKRRLGSIGLSSLLKMVALDGVGGRHERVRGRVRHLEAVSIVEARPALSTILGLF